MCSRLTMTGQNDNKKTSTNHNILVSSLTKQGGNKKVVAAPPNYIVLSMVEFSDGCVDSFDHTA